MNINEKKQLCANWFEELRNLICAEFEKIEQEFAVKNSFTDSAKFQRKNWQRTDNSQDGGYGEMSLMKGRVFEKVGVNFSQVYGEFNEEFRKEIPGAM